MAKQFVEGGLADCAMALGFEKMEKGSLGVKYTDRTNPMDKHFKLMVELRGFAQAPPAPQIFGNAGREHMERYGTTAEQFAKIGWKNHKHSVNNPYSQFQDEYSLERHPEGADGLRAAHQAAVLPDLGRRGRRDRRERGLRAEARPRRRKAVEIAGMAMATDFDSTFDEKSCIKLVGSDMTKKAAQKVYEQSRPRSRERRRGRAARLLLVQRADHLRGARPLPRGQGRRVHRRRAPTPTAARWS